MNEEEIIHLLKILEVGLLASVKFLLSPFEAERQGLNFKEAFIITTSGGLIGIVLFTYIGQAISYAWKRTISFFTKKNKQNKKFTWMNKFVVKIKQKFGLMGLVFATPIILSIPIGCFVIQHFYKNKIKNLSLLFVALLLWSILLNSAAHFLKLSQYLHIGK